MTYRGYTLRAVARKFPHAVEVRGMGIHRDGKLLDWAHDAELARRVIDERIRTGAWKEDANAKG